MTKISVNAGDRYGRLTIVEELPEEPMGGGKIYRKVKCACDCGNTKETFLAYLRKGSTTSCGCALDRKGSTKTPEYGVWASMKTRCTNPQDCNYEGYGWRGIEVCSRWMDSFENFYADMGPRPSHLHTLERIDNNKGYSPNNCKWATIREQSRNKRSNRNLTYEGQTMCLSDWAEEIGIHSGTLSYRIKKLGENGALAYYLGDQTSIQIKEQ